MKKTFMLSFFLLLSGYGISQSCLSEGIILSRQSQIDSFPINYPGCKKIAGFVSIRGNGITNLLALINLDSINGPLSIESPNSLINLFGLDSLKYLGGLGFIANSKLTSLTGLSSLNKVGGNVDIVGDNAFTNFIGLNSLTSIAGEFTLSRSSTLINMIGLEKLTSIGKSLTIYSQHSLQNFSGLENLVSIGGDLSIHDNLQSLNSLNAFYNLKSIGGNLEIERNTYLTSLSGLDSINANSITNLNISGNYYLSACSIRSICDYLASPHGAVTISNYTTGCKTLAEVKDACISSADNLLVNNRLSVYPNPSGNQITLEATTLPSHFHLCILNTVGMQFNHSIVTEIKTNIDISDFPPGVYILRITDYSTINTLKFIKN